MINTALPNTTLPTRQLGHNGPVVSAIGVGCMGMSGMYGAADEAEAIATIHAALDSGVNLLETGDFYGMGHTAWATMRCSSAGRCAS
jgi:aryl-alcohol dehydrogenase-like predicted oxidoreductase